MKSTWCMRRLGNATSEDEPADASTAVVRSCTTTVACCTNVNPVGCHCRCPNADDHHPSLPPDASARPARASCEICERLRDPEELDATDTRAAMTSFRTSHRGAARRSLHSSSNSCASSVVRWGWFGRQILFWLTLFLMVLVFPAIADSQKGSSKSFAKEEGGESCLF